jgi:hypothetical protein
MLSTAGYVDFDFLGPSQSLVITAFWPRSPAPGPDKGWSDTITRVGGDSLEVGILANEPPTEPEELSLGGILTVVGEDDKPSKLY